MSNTYLRLLLWNTKIDKKDRKSISENNLLNNNVNTVDLYQISRVILSYFLGIPLEFLGNRWQYYSRHLQKIYCMHYIYGENSWPFIRTRSGRDQEIKIWRSGFLDLKKAEIRRSGFLDFSKSGRSGSGRDQEIIPPLLKASEFLI